MNNKQDTSVNLLLKILEEKLKELDYQMDNTDQASNEDDFKILIGKQAFAEDLMHKLQSVAA